jgi:hypothetical protein
MKKKSAHRGREAARTSDELLEKDNSNGKTQ